uniref:Apple domain-containing protein n=1 Tax=Plectus sambesii TaxID=2011161 RepID=A0A914UKZ3_9BILA
MTYEGCKSDTTKSYLVGGWCFYFYYNSSWAPNTPTQDNAQTMCHPHGTLAVGVTSKMLSTYKNRFTSTSIPFGWVALVRNLTYPNQLQGWMWKTLLPNGSYATFPAIMSSIPWAPTEPNNNQGSEDAAMAINNWGFGDVRRTISNPLYGQMTTAVICQFAPQQWSFTQRGHGLFTNSAYQIAQWIRTKYTCLLNCHRSVFCVSFAFNPTTNDCQIYAVSPEDPQFAGEVAANSAYNWYIRDGMEY